MSKRVQRVLLLAVAASLFCAVAWAESAPPISECELCLGVAKEDPYVCLESVSAIPNDEEAIYVRARLEGPFTESHVVAARWIDPSGTVYREDVSTVPSASSQGYGWWNYHVAWFWIDIAGWPASRMLGEWRVDVFADGAERCTKKFTIGLSEEVADAIAAGVRECAAARFSSNPGLTWDLVFIEVNVGREAAGFPYEILYDTEVSGGMYSGQEIGLGPNAQSLELGGALDESGIASIKIRWPGDEETYFFQVLIGTSPLDLLSGSFWQSNVVRVDRPSEEEPLTSSGFDGPTGDLGTDDMLVCMSESPRPGEPDIEFQHAEDCLVLQLSPAGLVAGSESPLNLTFGDEGFVTVSPTDEPDGEAGYVAFLPVDLPLRPCCEELELAGLSFCYQSLTDEDRIESLQIGYLSDMGSFEELAVVGGDLASLTWDSALVSFNDVLLFRPLVIRIWFGFGGVAPLPAAGGVRLGNIRAVLAPRRPGPWSGRSSPGNITCAKLRTCFPWGGGWGPNVSCADGVQYHDYKQDPPQVIFYFWSHCEESITCEGWRVLDEMGDVIRTGGWVVRTAPAPEDGYYQWGEQDYYLGECFLPGAGSYEVVLETSLGEFTKKFSIELPD